MKVSELIEALNKVENKDAQVVFYNDNGINGFFRVVNKIDYSFENQDTWNGETGTVFIQQD